MKGFLLVIVVAGIWGFISAHFGLNIWISGIGGLLIGLSVSRLTRNWP